MEHHLYCIMTHVRFYLLQLMYCQNEGHAVMCLVPFVHFFYFYIPITLCTFIQEAASTELLIGF